MPPERALSVAEAMGLAKRALEAVSARVVGEVSELSDKAGYKAVYFTLSDGSACMPCMMWKDAFESSGVELRVGLMVEVAGAFTAYPPKGRMQFAVRALTVAGEGVLRMRVAEIARRLEAEGLMRAERKRSLPRYPERIALVTSPRGKAVWDVVRTLRRRYPLAELLVAGVAVEGAGAPEAIAEGLRTAAEAAPDVIILGRGGGSYEDLMPFNDERVARAVAECPVPVVTGIGHEPDTSIADMVADVRASTPTAAAEAAAPCVEDLVHLLDRERRLLGRGLAHLTQAARHRVGLIAARPLFTDATVLTSTHALRLDAASAGLVAALPERIARERVRLDAVRAGLVREGPRAVERAVERASIAGARLSDLSPLGILGRGYAACYRVTDGTLVRASADVTVGDELVVRVARGAVECDVTGTRPEG